ncbi:MAG TPA: hypothetical protein VKK79_08565 [Candidatus Lokiarchaeia archaeon]|nr:hypothetical protein [Candidatus Lokiarchaeia archaeon]
MSLLEQYQQVRSKWSKSGEMVPYDDAVGIHASFELGYHASNTPTLRCFFMKTVPEGDPGSQAALIEAKTQVFNEVLGLDEGMMLTSYAKEEDVATEEHARVIADYQKFCANFPGKDDQQKENIIRSILVERKVDEVVNLTLVKDIGRKVYFAIGETRERAALIPLVMDAEGGSLVQLALNKWMSLMSQAAPEDPIQEEFQQGLLKNFLQIKKWILSLVNKTLES